MKKTLHIMKKIFTWLVAVLAISMMAFTIISVNTFDRNDRSLFGYKAFIVLSDSMSKTDFDAGSLVLVKEVDPSTLQVGDIISYQSTNAENYGEVITHKIRELTTDAQGNPGFVTYGTTTDTNDENIVAYNTILGKYDMSLPGVGKFFQFLKTTPGYIVCILLPFMALIIMQGLNSIQLFRKYKEEQLAELKAERMQIEKERNESQEMMKELLKLKDKLYNESNDTNKSMENNDSES